MISRKYWQYADTEKKNYRSKYTFHGKSAQGRLLREPGCASIWHRGTRLIQGNKYSVTLPKNVLSSRTQCRFNMIHQEFNIIWQKSRVPLHSHAQRRNP